MIAYDLIDAKKRGRAHTGDEIRALVEGVTDGSIPDYQVSAWLMAVWHRGMTLEETVDLTLAMRDSGDVLDHSASKLPTADKHSTGGVGDKISLLLAPLAATMGLAVPMLSGRGLGHTGGTLDKLGAIKGYRPDLTPAEMHAAIEQVGCSILGQTDRIAPADRRLYSLRDVTATVDCVPLIVSSILSKKLAAGPAHLVIDLKCGSGAFMQDLTEARELAAVLLHVGKAAGLKISVLITDMGQPLGEAVGHSVEVLEAIEGMRGAGPEDQRILTCELAAEMASLSGEGSRQSQFERAAKSLDDGSALAKFEAMVRAHGGSIDLDREDAGLEFAPEQEPLKAEASGFIRAFQTDQVGWSVLDLGGGRRKHSDVVDLGVGLRVLAKRGAEVRAGDPLVQILARDEASASKARERLKRAIEIGSEPPAAVDLVLAREN